MTPEQKEKITSILDSNKFAVVSTFPIEFNHAPESAVVAISQTENLEIVFASFQTSRKNQNLKCNALASLVVGWDNKTMQTLQIEGKATFVVDLDEKAQLVSNHIQKNPVSKKYQNDPKQEYIKVVPTWIRYSDLSVDPQEVWEVAP